MSARVADAQMPSAALPRRTQAGTMQPAAQISVVQAFGVVGKRLDDMSIDCGGLDVDHLEAAIAAEVAKPHVQAIIIHFDSPGGVVTGVPELAAKIKAWNDQKPIFAFTDSLMASAAYWLACNCSAIFATPSADVGSIGVYCALVDSSEAWAKEGYKLCLIKAGDRKAEGIAGIPVTPETISALQVEIDSIYAMFTGDVTSARPEVGSAAMQGQTFMGAAALDAKLVDAIVPDLASVVQGVSV
jgi:signal peptide peptidase SppA